MIEEPEVCSRCSAPWEAAARWCARCGARRPRRYLCLICHQPLEPGTRTCPNCGVVTAIPHGAGRQLLAFILLALLAAAGLVAILVFF